jgi:transcriptional regulator with XRE-family HTH domain
MMTLQELRTSRQLSRKNLALRAGVGISTVIRIELGRTWPRPHVARRLSAVLGADLGEIAEFALAVRQTRLGRVYDPRPIAAERYATSGRTILAMAERVGSE